MLNSPLDARALAESVMAVAASLNKKAPGGWQGSGGRCGAVDGSKCPSFEDDNACFQGSEPRQGFLCRACRRSKWLPKSSAAWCRVRQRWVRFDEPVRYCREFRAALTHDGDSGMVEAPNRVSRNRRLALAPQGAEVLSAQTAISHAPAGSVSGGRRVHIGGAATSSIREDWRLYTSRGALLPRLFF